MNASVAKSVKKSSKAKPVGKSAAKAATPSKAKPAGKSGVKTTLKTVAGKVANAVKKVLKPAAKAVKPAKAVAKSPPKPAVKSAAKPAAKLATKAAPKKVVAKAPAKKPVKPAAAKKSAPVAAKASAAKPPSAKVSEKTKASEKPAPKSASSEPRKRDGVASVGITDKIEKIVVSKVSEVATKTSKSNSVVPADGTLLSEAQIMKMGDKDYMNPAQLAFFKARLQQLEKDLLKNAGETTEHLRETVLVPDPADRATIEEEHALELRTRDRERKLLKKVQQSIASIDSGDYGWCEETGEPIGVPRLLARPTATLSLEAQQRRELKQKLYGD
ncbi:hypothetical protein BH11PSE11_BH11PSE11_35830 [soil metagenome]